VDRFEQLKNEVKSQMDIDAIWNEEYKSMLAEEIAEEVREEARKHAEADIQRRRAGKRISR